MVNLAFAVALNYLQAVQLFISGGGWERTEHNAV